MKRFLLNLAFVLSCGVILIVLLQAPEETTPALPGDSDHAAAYAAESRIEAEKTCQRCHDPGKIAPLPADHPPQLRCLFCHKRNATNTEAQHTPPISNNANASR